jgi:hypothetical protein
VPTSRQWACQRWVCVSVAGAGDAAGRPPLSQPYQQSRPLPQFPPAWPTVRFHICMPHPHGHEVAVRGLLHRDDSALIVEFEFAKKNVWKKFKDFFQEPGRPQGVRIPLDQIVLLNYGWGWGRPPRSLIIKVRRLSALGGMPGSKQGQVQLYIQREDRPAARQLVESITRPALAGSGPGPATQVHDREQPQQDLAIPSAGLFLTGLLMLLSWFGASLFVVSERFVKVEAPDWLRPVAILAGTLIVPLSVLIMTGGVMMRKLRWYPLVAAAAIAAMVPLSVGWLIGLAFGIWTCIVLGKPEVAEAFHPSRASVAPAAPPSPGPIAGRSRSLLRSMGRYMLPTFLAARSAAGKPDPESPVEGWAARPTVDYAGTPRPPATGRDGHPGE